MLNNLKEFYNRIKKWQKRAIAGVTSLAMTMAFSVGMSGNYNLGYDAYVGDTYVATLDSFEDGNDLVRSVEDQYHIAIEEELNYYLRLVASGEFTEAAEAKENIKSTSNRFVPGTAIVVGDTVLCQLASRTEAAEAVLAFKAQFEEPGAVVEFDKEITQEPVYVLLTEAVTAEQAKAMLDENVTATSTVTSVVTEQIPYETQTLEDASMEVGQSWVSQAGMNGEKQVSYRITKINGEETAREVVSEITMKAPQTAIVYNGTKRTGIGTGTYICPTTGTFSSNFGSRWGRQHKGVDIANSVGTPIYAADSGKVIYSGWMTGFGYMIQIDHNNGYVTYYAHCSSLAKKVGDIVGKGDYIAAMGSTGNSTGSHLHFEIHENGVVKNPVNYVNFG